MLKNSSKTGTICTIFEPVFPLKKNSLAGKKIGIQSLFVSNQFKIDLIVCDRQNMTITNSH
jgi:hypothetical protein